MNSFAKGTTNRYTRRVYMSLNFKTNCYIVREYCKGRKASHDHVVIPGHVNSFKSTTKSQSQNENCKKLVKWKRNIAREFRVEFHAKNRYLAIRTISGFQVKFNLEFMSEVVNFLESHSFSRIKLLWANVAKFNGR